MVSLSRWAFDTPLPAPTVSLNSSVIVQRHVNALALATFLAESISGQDFTKLTCDWFFTGTPSPSERFQSFCLGFDVQNKPVLSKGLRQLVRHSAYEGMPQTTIIGHAAHTMSSVTADWDAEWSALLQQEQETLGGGKESPAHKAVLYQKGRMGGEYLLRELATRGFLPGYGFPSHITSFDNLTIGKYKQAFSQKAGREDNRYRKRELPSRDRVTALREYAPGSEVVMDGLMYRSAGITLNWHIPATQQDASEIQEIKFAWRCHHCGASGSTHNLSGCQTCEECGGDIKSSNIQRFLEPAGFAVDFFKDPTNDVTTQHFVPVEQPWITARGEWVPLANSGLGRFRTTSSGHIFYHSDGIHRQGYAICLACGRAAPMQSSGDLPQEFAKPHKKLRGGKLGETDCLGSSQAWAIQRGISLGHEAHTDVLEIQLKNEVGLWIKDSITARTLGIALRDALAELLGVQASELACDIKEAIPEEGKVCQSILIYDRSAAGYASSASRHVEQMFRLAKNRLQCKANCDSSCPHCILDFDQRFAFDGIDRFAALNCLTDNWLNMLRLPNELALFGEASQPEYCGLSEAILRENSQRDIRVARLFFSGRNADLGPSPLRRLAYRLAGNGTQVELVVDADSLKLLDETDMHLLASLADHPGITIASIRKLPLATNGFVLAEVSNSTNATRWGVTDEKALEAGVEWGTALSALIVGKALPPVALDALIQLESAELRPKGIEQGDIELEISQELDGPLQEFGKRLWGKLTEHHKAAAALIQNEAEQIVDVLYSDRYLWTSLTPLALYLRCEDWNRLNDPSSGVLKLVYRGGPDTKDPIYATPDWCSRDKAWMYAFGRLLRAAATGELDFTVRQWLFRDELGWYSGIRSTWQNRRMGMTHTSTALVGTTSAITPWFSNMLLGLLRWPGIADGHQVSELESASMPSDFGALIHERIRFQAALYGRSSGLPVYRYPVDWPLRENRHLRIVQVQGLMPSHNELLDGIAALSSPGYRARHRNHTATLLNLAYRKIMARDSVFGTEHRPQVDVVIFPELAVHVDDQDLMRAFSDATGAMLFYGLLGATTPGVPGPVNAARWLVPQRRGGRRSWVEVDQGKWHLTSEEHTKLGIEPWRPYQVVIELCWGDEPGYRISGAVCYDATDISLAADLKDETHMFVVAAMNRDVKTFDSMVSALRYHMYQHVLIANSGEFGGSTAQAPYDQEHKRLVSHVHGSNQIAVSVFEVCVDDFGPNLAAADEGKTVLMTVKERIGKTPPAGLSRRKPKVGVV